MNIFDLPGPEFLQVYAAIACGINLLLFLYLYNKERGPDSVGLELLDPCKIAYLRAGPKEVLRVVLVSLIDRGLVRLNQKNYVKAAPHAQKYAKQPLEKLVLKECDGYKDAADVVALMRLDVAVKKEYEAGMESLGLIPGAEMLRLRLTSLQWSCAGLALIAAAKIAIAISRGKYNILFLIGLSAIACVCAFKIYSRQRTFLGSKTLRQLKRHFSSLKARAATLKPGGKTNDIAFLAAVFGLRMLPSMQFPFVKELFPRATQYSATNSWTSGCGYAGGSVWSSGGCGGGAGCGGGGGCGGCGGG